MSTLIASTLMAPDPAAARDSRSIRPDGPFGKSLNILLDAASRLTGSSLCVLYEIAAERSLVLRGGTWNGHVDPPRTLTDAAALTAWVEPVVVNARDGHGEPVLRALASLAPVGVVVPIVREAEWLGVLLVGLEDASHTPRVLNSVGGIALSLGRILAESSAAEHRLRLAARLDRLRADLADRKLVDRLRGVLSNTDGSKTPGVVPEYIDRVLDGLQTPAELREECQALEDQIESRRVLARAKLAIQQRDGCSEEQAYLLLRNASRKARKPLRQIAEAVLLARRLA